MRFPGTYPIHRGEKLSSVLARAGGFTDLAFIEGTIYLREELKKREKDQLELLTNRMQSDLAALSLEAISLSAATSNATGAQSATQGLAIGQQLVAQLKEAKPVGRLVIDLNKVMKGGSSDVIVRDGDKLLIPKESQEVTVLGEAQSPTSHVYQAGLTRTTTSPRAAALLRRRTRAAFMSYAQTVMWFRTAGRLFRRSQAIEMRPGDTIVVPLDNERIRALPLWQSVDDDYL